MPALLACLALSFAVLFQNVASNTTKPDISRTPRQSGNREAYWDKAFAPDLLPVWIGGGAAFLASIAGLVALYRSRGQTEAALIAARASQTSADAVIAGDRPWILIEGIKFDDPNDIVIQNRTIVSESFHFVLRNWGRTPARITVLKSRVEISDSETVPPFHEIYRVTSAFINPHIIPQTDCRAHKVSLQNPVSSQQYLSILGGGLFLWAGAVVCYEDVHGNKYETRVCYRNDSEANRISELRLDGPPEYNNAK